MRAFQCSSFSGILGALGGTLNGDPCSLLGAIGVLPGYVMGIQGLYKGYIEY